MYCNDTTKIKLGDHLSDTIYPNKGVRQGCILSPLLFNIYLSNLPGRLSTATDGPKIGDKNLNSIIWADDLVILSESEEGLNKKLSELALFADEYALTINSEKTKAMIFNKTGRLIRRNFKYKNTNIETVREYKYLGFVLVPSGSIIPGIIDLKSRGNRAIAKIRSTMGEYFKTKPSISIKLFNTLVKPILLYMADLWGCMKMPKNNPIEIVQTKFLKQVLGVQIQTTNVGVLLETGELPMINHAEKHCIKNWVRLMRNKGNNLSQMSLNDAMEGGLIWIENIKKELFSVGLGNIFLSVKNATDHIEHIYFQRINDIFHQLSFAKIREKGSKLRTYGLFKEDIGYEKYLTEVTSVQKRVALTKFRLSNHTLMIEKGRHLKIESNKRYFPFCPNLIEDEIHFLFICKTFEKHRKIFLKNIEPIVGSAYFRISSESKLVRMMTDPLLIKITAKYVQNTMEIRNFLLEQYKNNM